MKRISIIIPAHNEAGRLGKTLDEYFLFFIRLCGVVVADFELLVVLNGCTDATGVIVEQARAQHGNRIRMLDLGASAGKGLAVAAGFRDALMRDADYIGFVDADMATQPPYFAELMYAVYDADGAIASRYMPHAQVFPPRPWIKSWGSWLVYRPLVRLLFGLPYYDYQCGAKLFTRAIVATIVPYLTIKQWAFDVELLYVAKKFGYTIKEVPTVWYDQTDSKLRVMRSGLRMLSSLFEIYRVHAYQTYQKRE